MFKSKYFYSTFYVIILLAFTGCASSLKIQAAQNGTQNFCVDLDLGKVLAASIQEISAGMAQMDSSAQNEIVIFEPKKIKSALENSGFKNVKTSSEKKESLHAEANGNLGNFVVQEKNSLSVLVNEKSVKKIASLLGAETESFLDLLMAPVFTGEKMTADEYVDLIAVVYGENLAAELKKSSLELTLSSPAGKAKKFSIPLAEFLSSTAEKKYSVEW